MRETIVKNEAKGVAPLILAYIEVMMREADNRFFLLFHTWNARKKDQEKKWDYPVQFLLLVLFL